MTDIVEPVDDPKFDWSDDEIVILDQAVLSAVIDGEAIPWFDVSWDPGRVDIVAAFTEEMDGAPTFNADMEWQDFAETMVRALWAVVFDGPQELPDTGHVASLRLTGAVDLEIPLGQ